jgi:hypothetical protein
MPLPKILGKKDPEDFFNLPMRIHSEKGICHVKVEGPEMDFQSMLTLRGKDCNPSEVKESLQNEGYVFANLGLSVALTLTLDNKNYAVVVKQDRTDLGDTVCKLISGYIDARNIYNPLRALDEEIAEEFPVYKESKEGVIILPGMRNFNPLPKPFIGENVSYDPNVAFQMLDSDIRISPDLTEEEINLAGKIQKEGSPRLYFQIPSNSAQLVYNFHVDIPKIPSVDPTLGNAEKTYLKNGFSVAHTEDTFDPKSGALEIRSHEQGLLLIALNGEKLTDEVYTFEKGELKHHTKKIILSEAFAPKENGIAEIQNISLEDYLNR